MDSVFSISVTVHGGKAPHTAISMEVQRTTCVMLEALKSVRSSHYRSADPLYGYLVCHACALFCMHVPCSACMCTVLHACALFCMQALRLLDWQTKACE